MNIGSSSPRPENQSYHFVGLKLIEGSFYVIEAFPTQKVAQFFK